MCHLRKTGLCLLGLLLPFGLPALDIKKVAEEKIAVVPFPNNGSSPLWCYGSSIFVRDGENLYLSLQQVDEEYPPSCNCHWELMKREGGEWKTLFSGGKGLEREPCPLIRMGPGELVLSTQSKLTEKPFHDGQGDTPWYAKPGLLGIYPDETDNDDAYHHYHPTFPDGAQFTDTSYRGIAVDPKSREILLMIIDQRDDNYVPAWFKQDGSWESLPDLEFPIRACYPQIVIRDREAHVLAIGDIYEPIEEWREYKYEKLQRRWDYAFRRLFYSWSPDLGRETFREPVEIDSVDDTAGHMLNLDLYVDESGRAHVLYIKKPQQFDFMRDRFFPGEPMTVSLEYAVLEQGKVIKRSTLHEGSAEESYPKGLEQMHAWSGKLHPLPQGGLGIVFTGAWTDTNGEKTNGMFFAQISKNGKLTHSQRLPVEKTFNGMYFTNTQRSGSDVGKHLDIVGAVSAEGAYEMRYIGFEIE